MIKAKKVLSSVLIMLFTLISVFNCVPAQAAGKPVVVPQVQFATAPVTEYMVGDRVGFNIYSPNYGGRVEYRVVLWNDARKSYSDLWDASNGYPTRYYTKWQPYGNNIFTLGWIINEPGSYRITVYAKRVGIPNSQGALKGYNCDSYMESVAFRVKSKEATVQSILPPADVTVNQGAIPVLPTTVRAVMSDATQKDLRVTWGTVNTTTPGTFIIPGTVEGTSLKASLRLIVNPLSTTLNVNNVEANSINTVKVNLISAIGFTPELSRFSLREYGYSDVKLYSLTVSTDKKFIQLSTDTLNPGNWYILKVDGKEYTFQVPYNIGASDKVVIVAKDVEVKVNGSVYPDVKVYPSDAVLSYIPYDDDIAEYDPITGKIIGLAPGKTTFYVVGTKTGLNRGEATFKVEVSGYNASLQASPTRLIESAANNGSLANNKITVISNYDYFNEYIDEGDVSIPGLPQGLKYMVERTSVNTLEITIYDSAKYHNKSNSTSVQVEVYKSGLYGSSRTLVSNEIQIDFYDNNAPAPPEIYLDPETPTKGSVEVTIDFPDNTAAKEYKLGESGTYRKYTGSFTVSENTTVYARYRFTSGVWSIEAVREISNIDKTPPTRPTIKIIPTTPTNQPVEVDIVYPSDAVVKEYKIGNGDWQDYEGAFEVTDNNTTVYARCQDAVGNSSAVASKTISNIDTTKPAAPQLSKTVLSSGKVRVTIAYSSDTKTKKYRIGEDGDWLTYTQPINISENTTVYAYGIDAAGNASDWESIVIDEF